MLGVDANAWKNFLLIWREVEPILYLIANRRGEKARNGIGQYADTLEREIDSYSVTSLKVKTEEDIRKIGEKLGINRYKGLNLKNLYESKSPYAPPKNTIEFRLPNGNVNYDIIRENVLLFGRMIRIAKLRAVEPSIKKKEFEALLENDLEEKEKVERLLNLLFDTEREKSIFRNRWVYNSGGRDNVFVRQRKYKKQWVPEKLRLKEEIAMIAENVSQSEQMYAMEAMVGDLTQQHETEI